MNESEALQVIVSAGEAEKSPAMIAVSKGGVQGPWPGSDVYYSNGANPLGSQSFLNRFLILSLQISTCL